MPFKAYRITSPFGNRKHPISGKNSFHTGIDLVKLKGGRNAPIESFTAGTVLFAGMGKSGSGFGGYGNVVLIKDKNNRGQVYAHLHSISVKKGQVIKKGQIIGRQGNTGNSTGPHLHYEVRKKAESKVPFGWISDRANNCLNPTSYLKEFVHTQANPMAKLTVDGKWANATTRALQTALKTTVDGIISDQSRNPITSALYGTTVQFGNGKKGSMVIKALQRKLGGLKVDGLLGPATVKRLQTYLKMKVVDSKLSRPSAVVKELQRRLNAGTF